MSYLNYKDCEEDLKNRFAKMDIVVRIEPVVSADVYYTDGDASTSVCKLIFTGGNTVYIPQLIYNVDPIHKKIIEDWMLDVKGSATGLEPATGLNPPTGLDPATGLNTTR
jgi:hypothetical protein